MNRRRSRETPAGRINPAWDNGAWGDEKMKAGLRKKLIKESLRTGIFERIAFSFNRSSGLKSILRRILADVNRFFGSEASSIILKDELRRRLFFFLARGEKSRAVVKYDLKYGEGICGWVISNNKPLLSRDPYRDRRFKKEIDLAVDYKTRSIVCVPLSAGRTAIGCLEIINKKGMKNFPKEDVSFLAAVANQVAILIRFHRLVGQLGKRVDELSSLIRVSETVGSTLDLTSLLDSVMKESKRVMKTEASSLMLLEDSTGDLVFHAVRGARKDQVREMRVPAGKGIAGWIAKKGKPCIVNDVKSDRRFYRQTDRRSRFKTRQIIGVPLLARGKILGVVEALNKKDRSDFDKRDIKLFMAMARLSALAIQNAKYFAEGKELFLSTISSLAVAIDAKDPYTHGHSERVTQYAVMTAESMGLASEELKNIQFAGLLHDVGKIGIDDRILRKPGKLTDEEFMVVRKHPATGEKIMQQIREFEKVLPGIRSHHERFDGKGYPDGLAKDRIPLSARILAVADTFDAMTSDRPYRKRMEISAAIEEIKKCSGLQYDPEIVKIFLNLHKDGRLDAVVNSQSRDIPAAFP